MKFEELVDESLFVASVAIGSVMKITNELRASRSARTLSQWYPTVGNDINELLSFVKAHERNKQPIDERDLGRMIGKIRRSLMQIERSDETAPHISFVNDRLNKIERFALQIGNVDDQAGRITRMTSQPIRKLRRFTL